MLFSKTSIPITTTTTTAPPSNVNRLPPPTPPQQSEPGTAQQLPLQHTFPPNHPLVSPGNWTFTNDPTDATSQSAFRNHMVIPPPERRDTVQQHRTSYVVVDSSSRNHSDYPNPNDYTIALPTEIRDVKQLQLVSYKIPRNQSPVRYTNNTLHYTNTRIEKTSDENGCVGFDAHRSSFQKIVLPEGVYDGALTAPPGTQGAIVEAYRSEIAATMGISTSDMLSDQLAHELETRLNSNAASTYVVYLDSLRKQYTIATNFANPAGDPNSCDDPVYFQMFFHCHDRKSHGKCRTGEAGAQYLKNSIGPVLGHPRTDTQNKLMGTIVYTSGDQTLRGTGTCFTTELQPGDWLYIADTDTDTRYRVHIQEVVSDTEARLDCDGQGGGSLPVSGEGYAWNGRVTMPWTRNLQPDCYLSMFVNCANTLTSATPAIDGAFYLMPAVGDTFYDIPTAMPFESFSPILGRLDKLTISFRNPDNTLYDFMGANHVLLFKVVHYRPDVAFGDV